MGGHLIALVDQSPVPYLLDDPPDALDVAVVHGDVGVLHVHPVADTLGQLVPLLEIAEDAFAAFGVELGDAVLLYLGFAREAELLLDLKLDRQAVGIPAADARGIVALHYLVARDNILEDAGQHVMDAGAAVGSGRPLVEDEALAAFPGRHAAAEDIALLPAGQDWRLHLREIHPAVHRLKHNNPLIVTSPVYHFMSLRVKRSNPADQKEIASPFSGRARNDNIPLK